jgi:hypothetical protein
MFVCVAIDIHAKQQMPLSLLNTPVYKKDETDSIVHKGGALLFVGDKCDLIILNTDEPPHRFFFHYESKCNCCQIKQYGSQANKTQLPTLCSCA